MAVSMAMPKEEEGLWGHEVNTTGWESFFLSLTLPEVSFVAVGGGTTLGLSPLDHGEVCPDSSWEAHIQWMD